MLINDCFYYTVSLFTREWIEMVCNFSLGACSLVSLFTREWIEIQNLFNHRTNIDLSPSLRGSGLKSVNLPMVRCQSLRLPLYEWVDWNRSACQVAIVVKCLPLYEGVDWNTLENVLNKLRRKSPSLRGSGLKLPKRRIPSLQGYVSLFTREWIEIRSERWQII